MQPRLFSLSREQVRAICPECADRMQAAYLRELKLQVTADGDVKLGDGSSVKLFAGFSQGLCDKFGGDEGFFTRCADGMSGKVDDEKAFCASLHKFCVGKWPAEKEHEERNLEEGIKTFLGAYPAEAAVQQPLRKMFDEILAEKKSQDTVNRLVWSINDSICRIVDDKSLTSERRDAMLTESMQQFMDAVHSELPVLSTYAEAAAAVENFDGGKRADRLVLLENSNAIKDVEIFATGNHNGDEYTEKDLDDMVVAFGGLDFRPAVKIGHTKDKPGAPSYGWVQNLKRVGNKLYADLTDMHDSVVDAIRSKAYDRVSSEIYFNLKRGDKQFRRALKAVALLGAEVPAVANLVPLHKVEFAEQGFDKVGAFEQGLDVSTKSLLDAVSERVAGLSNLIKEYDMSKNTEQIKQLKAQVAEFNSKMDEMRKKKGKKSDDEMMDDEEYKQLATQLKTISTKVTQLEAEDKTATDATFAQLQKDLAESKAREEVAVKERKEMSERISKIEQEKRNQRIGEHVKACKIPSFRSGLEAIYAYALEHTEAKVKVYSKDKEGKDTAEEKTLADVVDGFVAQINDQSERLFKAMAHSGVKVREDGAIEESADKEVQKRVSEFRTKNPTVKTYEEAMKAVLAADPELSKRWQEQFGPAQ